MHRAPVACGRIFICWLRLYGCTTRLGVRRIALPLQLCALCTPDVKKFVWNRPGLIAASVKFWAVQKDLDDIRLG